MNSIFYAHSGTIIRISCPRCRIVTKYDVDFIEEAIKEKKNIICIACEECFELVPQKSYSITRDEIVMCQVAISVVRDAGGVTEENTKKWDALWNKLEGLIKANYG